MSTPKSWKFFLIFIICFQNIVTEDGHDHEDEDDHSHGTASQNILIDKIAEHLGVNNTATNETLFAFKDIEMLFEELGFINCTNKENIPNCNVCFKAKEVLVSYKYNENSTLTKEQFGEFLTGLLYLLLPQPTVGVVCKTFKTTLLANATNSFQLYTQHYGNGGKLSEESIEKILDAVNKTVGHNLGDDDDDHCFSAHDVLSGVNVSDEHHISEHELESISAFIVLKLLDKHCIKEEEHVTESTYFVKELLSEFGNGTHMDHEKFKSLLEKLKLGGTNATSSTDNHGHHEHEHDRKRRSVESPHSRVRREVSKQCYSAEKLLKIYSVSETSSINSAKFEQICPSLIQQLESGACVTKTDSNTGSSHSSHTESSSSWKPWVGSMISILIISLFSMLGVVAAPMSDRKWFPYLIMFFIALAISVLIGDAMLHLLPHALELHGHNKEEEGHDGHDDHDDHDLLVSDSYLWKCVMFLVGIYVFYMFELIMHTFGHSHSHNADSLVELEHAGRSLSLSKEPVKGKEETVIANEYGDEKGAIQLKSYSNGNFKSNGYPPANYGTNATQPMPVRKFRSLVWLILIGDAIHNFMDGVAIGAAFTEEWPDGLHGGISTSIAILCHELPHELGDFAVLLNSGLSIKQALLMNFISSLTAFGGGILGVILASQWNASTWIFAITAGLFVYIALADMLPEVLHSKLLKQKPALAVGIQSIGFLVGSVILFVIAAWEDDIKTAFK